MAPPPNNPAARLLIVLNALAAFGKQRGESRAIEAWASALSTHRDNLTLLLTRIAHANALPQLVANRLETIENINPALYLHWVGPVHDILSPTHLGQKARLFSERIVDGVLYPIAVCEEQLRRLRPEPILDPQALNELVQDVLQLIDDISKADLPDSFRDFLLGHLQIVERSIMDYRIQGMAAIHNALEQSIGRMQLHRTKHDLATTTPVGRSVLDKLYRWAFITYTALNTVPLLEENAAAIKDLVLPLLTTDRSLPP